MSRHSQISRCAPIGLKKLQKLDDAEKLTKINIHLKYCKLKIKNLFLFRIEYIRDSGSYCGLK